MSSNLVESLNGTKLIHPKSQDVKKLVEISNTMMYSEKPTLQGQKKMMAFKLADSDEWIKLDLSNISPRVIQDSLEYVGCI